MLGRAQGMFYICLADCPTDSIQYNTIWCLGLFCTVVGFLFTVAQNHMLLTALGANTLYRSELVRVVADVITQCLFTFALLHGIYVMQDARLVSAMEDIDQQNRDIKAREFSEVMAQKDRFLSSTSHELRTPLNGIIGLSDIMLSGACGEMTDRQVKNLNTIKTSGARLLNLINDILDAAAMRERKLVIKQQKLQLKKLVTDVVDLHATRVSKDVKLMDRVPDNLPEVVGDPERIVQILHNLIGNSMKFTHHGSIKVSAKVEPSGDVAVSVTDTGIGIPEDKLASVFKPFEQGDMSTTRKYGGTGLGLSLVQQLVEAHNGTIKVKSIVDKGSRFTFTLPTKVSASNSQRSSQQASGKGSANGSGTVSPNGEFTPSSVSHGQSPALTAPSSRTMTPPENTPRTSGQSTPSMLSTVSSAAGGTSGALRDAVAADLKRAGLECVMEEMPSGWAPAAQLPGAEGLAARLQAETTQKQCHKDRTGRIKVLSVDDDAVNQEVVQELLRPFGYEVVVALDGLQALEILARDETLPDLILLDVMMPGMSGYEVCGKIREMFPHAPLPIIMISAKTTEQNIVTGLVSGSNDYVTKPFQRDEVLARINTQLRLKELWHQEMQARMSLSVVRKVLPQPIVERLKAGSGTIADRHEGLTVLCADVVDFPSLAASVPPSRLVVMLSTLFEAFDALAEKHGVHKVDSVGETYMVVAGHQPGDDAMGARPHACRVMDMALAMLEAAREVQVDSEELEAPSHLRVAIGISTGRAFSGVLGSSHPRYCFFGDAVTRAARRVR